jgi:hypothetical protein
MSDQTSPQRKMAFLSYSSADREFADKLCKMLEDRGVDCWIAPRDVDPGRNYAEEIITALDSTRSIVLVVSEKANQSVHVQKEVERAVHKGQTVFPVRIKDVQLSKALEYFISTSQWIDAFKPPLDEKVDRLASAILSLAGHEARIEPKKAPAPKSKTGLLVAIIAILVLAGAGTAYMLLKSNGEKPPEETLPEFKVTGVSAPVEAALKQVYTAKLEGPEPTASVIVAFRRGDDQPWQMLKDGQDLSSADQYRVMLRPQETAHFYLFQFDSRGKLDFIFPKNEANPHSMGSNPVAPGEWTGVPAEGQAFRLDDNVGIEHLFVVVTQKAWGPLEQTLANANAAQPSGSSENPLALRTRGSAAQGEPGIPEGIHGIPPKPLAGKQGVLAIERWFRHVAAQ